jgi:hypothetical protein
MALTKEDKAKLITEYHMHDGDTGSADVQIAILTTRIKQLTEHLQSTRQCLSPRPAQNGWPTPQAAGLSAPNRLRQIRRHYRKTKYSHPVKVIKTSRW